MIDLGRPALHAEGVTLFPDHADAARFHYLPDRPRIRLVDGAPEISLLKYRLDPSLHEALGAGLFSLTVDLGVDDEPLERLRRRAAASAGVSRVQLTPLAADSGRCELVLIDRSSADAAPDPVAAPAAAAAVATSMVARILGAATPTLFGHNAATFIAVLPAEGVALVEGALAGGGLPAGVIYTLEARGLRPALRAEITARWSDVYDFYENRLRGGRLLLATDIGPTIEDLVHREAISITVDELVPGEERQTVYDQALEEVQRYVLEELFTPTLGQTPPPDDDGGPLAVIGRTIKDLAGFFAITYSLREVNRNELKTFSYRLGVARAEKVTLAPQGTLTIMLGSPPDRALLDRFVTEVEPGPSVEMRFDVGVGLDLDAEGIDHIEAFVEYGDRRESLVLDKANSRRPVTFWYRPETGLALRYAYDVHFRADTAGRTDRLLATPRTTDKRVIRLNPRELYKRVGVKAVAQGLPFDRYPTVLVDIGANDPAEGWAAGDTLQLDAAHPEASFETRASLDSRVLFRRRVRYVDTAGAETIVDWDEVDPGVLVVGDPLPDLVDVPILAAARFDTAVRRLVVELRPVAHPEAVTSRMLTADQPGATWSWRVAAGESREYEYRVTVHTTLSEVREGPWLHGPPGKLIVGEGFARLRPVEMLLVGRSFADLGLLALKVRFTFEDRDADLVAEEEILVRDARAPVKWAYPVADSARQAYTYQVTYIRSNGTLDAKPPVATSELLIVHALS